MSLTGESMHAGTAARDAYSASPGDYFALMKPRVMSLVVLTALTGFMAAPGHVHPVVGFAAILAISVGAGASGALNMWYDADIDAKMARTALRPVPSGKVAAGEALAFGLILSALSVLLLGVVANWFSAAFLAFTIFFYAVVYTMWLKRSTPQNIVIGGAAGAFPPMIGYAAAGGGVTLESFVLYAIIFVWTPPHFWSLALYRAEDYAKAGLPMLPVTHGRRYTQLMIVLYTFALIAVTLLPFAIRMSGLLYLAAAVVLGAIFLGYAMRLQRNYSHELARATFKYSIVYLAALFSALLVDHYWR